MEQHGNGVSNLSHHGVVNVGDVVHQHHIDVFTPQGFAYPARCFHVAYQIGKNHLELIAQIHGELLGVGIEHPGQLLHTGFGPLLLYVPCEESDLPFHL